MYRYRPVLALAVLVTGCAELVVWNMAAAEQRITRAQDRVAVLDIPDEEKAAIKVELDDALARANLGRRLRAPTKPPPEIDLGSDKDNTNYNALEGAAQGALRRAKAKDAVFWLFRWFWKVLKFIRNWGWTIAMLALGFWGRKKFKQIWRYEVRRERDSDDPKDKKRARTAGTPAQDIYRAEKKAEEKPTES